MRSFLKEFLSDKRVIEAKGPVWWLVFNLIILTKRPKSSDLAYKNIWNNQLDESPLKTNTRAQSVKVAKHLSGSLDLRIDWAMRYG